MTDLAPNLTQRVLAVERKIIAAKAREWAGNYSAGTDGRNTFTLFAEWVDSRAPLKSEVKL